MSKTHWKKVVSDPNYIGEADFQDGQEIIVTIQRVAQHEEVKTAEGKSDKAVVHFAEKGIKPMILNVARSKNIEKVSGSPYFEDWAGVKIQLYIEHGIKAFGDIVNAVRVRPFRPRVQEPEDIPACSDCGGEIKAAMGKPAVWVAAYTEKNYGSALCADCAAKRKAAAQEAAEEAAEEGDVGDGVSAADG